MTKATPFFPRSLAVWPDSIQVGQIAEPICLVSPDVSVTEQDEANARLIAAAPDLLAALKALHSAAWEKGCSALLSEELQAAMTAIAKAEQPEP